MRSISQESVDDQVLQRNGKLVSITTPQEGGLARFFIFNSASRPYETRQATSINNGGNVFGYKRSSSALDALTGVTLGKRSAPNYEFVNMEPIYGRQFSMHVPMPRMYDLRWGPLDYDGSNGSD